MSEQVNCPFCGNMVDKNALRCPSCDALFDEPKLPDIKFQEFRVFIALEILTFGLFGTLWFFINGRKINKLTDNTSDSIKLNWLVGLLLLNVSMYIFYLTQITRHLVLSLFVVAQYAIFIALTYRVLRIIQKYTKKIYNVTLEINPYYIVIFNVLYLIHFVDTYTNRVMQVHEHFNPKSPQMILLIILLLIIQFMFCLDPNVHHFYKWLFGI